MFKVALLIQKEALTLNAELDAHIYDEELDDIVSVLDNICSALGECKAARFEVDGFGQHQWPTDVHTDLSVFLEQLPSVSQWLRIAGDDECLLDFYEQGVERKLVLKAVQDNILIKCISCTSWRPNPDIESVDRTSFTRMCSDVFHAFVFAAGTLSPNTVRKNEMFKRWYMDIVGL